MNTRAKLEIAVGERIKEVEVAGLSPVLFHVTSYNAMANIAKSNRLELKPAEGTDWEKTTQGHGRANLYYLSTSRTLSGGYIQGNLHDGVIFVLDGRRLGERCKGLPVDYWGPDSYKSYADGMGMSEPAARAKRFESEDRVLTDKPWIAPASRYITAVHVKTPRGANRDKQIAEIRRWCLLNKVPFSLYPDERSFALLDKRKIVPFEPVAEQEVDKYVPSPEYRQGQFKRARQGMLHGWVALAEMPQVQPDKRSAMIKKGGVDVDRAYRQLRYSDTKQIMSADMHNAKSVAYGDLSKNREALDKLVRHVAKAGGIEKFIAHLTAKWYD